MHIVEDGQCKYCLARCANPCSSFAESMSCPSDTAMRMDGWFEYDERKSEIAGEAQR